MLFLLINGFVQHLNIWHRITANEITRRPIYKKMKIKEVAFTDQSWRYLHRGARYMAFEMKISFYAKWGDHRGTNVKYYWLRLIEILALDGAMALALHI